jgi:flavin reductase (DIM6/NTAB) family NADH-FMN oxidoreductase RutF
MVHLSEVTEMKKSLGAKTLALPTPVWLVGTYDAAGRANVMTAAWGGICCSRPPCVAVSLRKATYSHANIVARQAFTISVPSEDQIVVADYFGIASGRDGDKIAQAGYTAVRSDLVDAPYIQECSLILECRLFHTNELGLHTQFVGEIVDVKADENALTTGGAPDIEKVRPALFGPGASTYHGIGRYLGQAFSIGKGLKR